MAAKRKTKIEAVREDFLPVAKVIAARLFRTHNDRQAQRLLQIDDVPQHEYGGWGEQPVADVIADELLKSHRKLLAAAGRGK